MDDEEEVECVSKTLKLLNDTKQKILDIWEKEGNFDFGMFNVEIDLCVVVNDNELRVKDKWKRGVIF